MALNEDEDLPETDFQLNHSLEPDQQRIIQRQIQELQNQVQRFDSRF
jgi:hypothetical protein